jgi:predicted dehydrogenase
MSKFGVGLIGCGVMGSSLAKGCNELDHAGVVAVSDVVEEAGKKLGDGLGVTWHADFREMLKREDVQAVMIALPGFMHAEAAVAAAAAGKHVFSEKPMAVTLEDCDAMIAACEKNKVKLQVGQVCRFHAVHSKVKQMVNEGVIGQPACMIVRRLSGGWGGVWARSWRNERKFSGGTLMEVNAHEIDFMRWVCGDVASVVARGGQFREKMTDYEDVMLVTMTFRSGALGWLHSSSISAIGEYGGRLDGTEGSLFFPSIWGSEGGIRYARLDEQAQFIPASEIQVENPVRAELRAFVDSILNDTTPPVTGQDGRAVVEIALAAYRSSATGEAVSLPLA